MVPVLQYEKDGGYVDATNVSTNATANTRLVKFEVKDLTKKLNVKLSVDTKSNFGIMTHTVQFLFDPAGIPVALSTGSGEPTNPTEPSNPTDPTDPTDPNQPTIPTEPIKNGFYSLNYTILKNGTDSSSVMESYVEHPGVLEYSGSTQYAYIVLTQSAEITGFRVGGSEVSTVAVDPETNKRLVKFHVPDLSSKLSGWVKIDWDAMDYHHSYDIQISFQGVGGKVSDPQGRFVKTGTGTGLPMELEKEKEKETNKDASKDGDTGKPSSSGGTATSNIKLSDITAHWAKTSIERAVSLGFVTGYKDGTFHPNSEVSRAEFAAMIVRALKLEGETANLNFKDTNQIPAWSQPYVAQAVKAGIISGYSDQTFRAADNTNRAELTAMIVRALGLPVDANSKDCRSPIMTKLRNGHGLTSRQLSMLG